MVSKAHVAGDVARKPLPRFDIRALLRWPVPGAGASCGGGLPFARRLMRARPRWAAFFRGSLREGGDLFAGPQCRCVRGGRIPFAGFPARARSRRRTAPFRRTLSADVLTAGGALSQMRLRRAADSLRGARPRRAEAPFRRCVLAGLGAFAIMAKGVFHVKRPLVRPERGRRRSWQRNC